jgi:pilus assembly protein FimV
MMIINRVSAAIIAGLSVLGMADPVWALGFGRPTSRAILGESLNVTVPVRLDAGEDLTEDCVVTDVYFGDDKLSTSAVTTTLLPGSGSERTVRVSTTSLVNEPVVTVYVAAGCKAKVSRKFVAFADPPGLMTLPSQALDTMAAVPKAAASPVNDASVKATALSADSLGDAQALALAAPKEGRKARRERLAAERQSARANRVADAGDEGTASAQPAPRSGSGKTAAAVVAAAPTKARKADTPAVPKVSRELSAKVDTQAPRSGARLELDPVEADAVVAPTLMMSAGMIGTASEADTPEVRERRAAAAALWAAMNASPEQLARDRQRLQELEARLQHLQQESAGANEKVAAMEARVRLAEQHSLRQPLVYGLAAACGLLLLAVGWLFMRQRRLSQTQDAWWQGEASEEGAETAPTMAEPALARTSAEFMPVRADATPMGLKAPALAAEPSASNSTMGADAAPKADLASSMVTRPVSIKPESQEPVREITVEELIDLEQQAEFFVVLGQDDAALELLESHVQTTAGASPLPHLKLLEIYQRLGRRADYERVQAAFNGRFNAYAPSWESDLQQGHSLEDYPGVVERLQTLWSQPALAMDVLQVSLTRPDDSIETFDLPAYRELLFLYAVARDLSERESKDRAPVDLVLPHHADGEIEAADQVAPLMATRPVKAVPTATPSLSLDLSLDEPAPSGHGGFVDDPITQHGNSIDFDLDEPPLPKR